MTDTKSHISFIDLAAQQKTIRAKIDKRIKKVLDHGRYILGPEVQEFEEKIADFVGVKHAIGVSSGTDALLMALMAWGIGKGDAVFTTPFTFIATAEVISLLGATPVFVDIDPKTYNIDPNQLNKAIKALNSNDSDVYPLPANYKELTAKAIIPVDLFGLPADYDPIMDIAKKNNLLVLEDAAQGFGGVYKGRMAGSLADIGTTSFFPAKPLGCYGDGGAIFTDNDDWAEKLRSIRVHGKGTDKYDNIRIGLNARLHTIQAAILLSKLEIFPQEVKAKQQLAKFYSEKISKANSDLIVPSVPDGLESSWAQYSLNTKKRSKYQFILQKAGIPTAVYYERPLHLQPAYKGLQYSEGNFIISESISKNIFSLPMHAFIKDGIREYITQIIISV